MSAIGRNKLSQSALGISHVSKASALGEDILHPHEYIPTKGKDAIPLGPKDLYRMLTDAYAAGVSRHYDEIVRGEMTERQLAKDIAKKLYESGRFGWGDFTPGEGSLTKQEYQALTESNTQYAPGFKDAFESIEKHPGDKFKWMPDNFTRHQIEQGRRIDEKAREYMEKIKHRVKKKTATIQEFRTVKAGQVHSDKGAIKQLILDTFFPDISEELKYIVVNDLDWDGKLGKSQELLVKVADTALKMAYDVVTGRYLTDPMILLKQLDEGDSLRNVGPNVLGLDVQKINSIIQGAIAGLNPKEKDLVKLNFMNLMIKEFEDKKITTTKFFERYRDLPMNVLMRALPLIWASHAGIGAADLIIEQVARNLGMGLPGAETGIKKVLEEPAQEVEEALDDAAVGLVS
jgi:hypothetical protein